MFHDRLWSSSVMTVAGGEVGDPPTVSGDGRELGDQVLPLIVYLYPPGFVIGSSSFVDTHLADYAHFKEGI